MSTVDYINMFVQYLTQLIAFIKDFLAGLGMGGSDTGADDNA